MRSCINCKNRSVCSIQEAMAEIITKGLQRQVLTPTDNGSTTTVMQAMPSALARSCNSFSPYEDIDALLSDDKKDEVKKIVTDLKNDSDFVEEFLNQPSPEHRSDLIQSYLDEDDLMAILDQNEDALESLYNYILKNFGL